MERTIKNPWRGLASYEDPAKTTNQVYEFCGRDEEASQLVRLIDNSLFVTLYGRTGVGKTSLLKAGVFPVMRLYNYVPFYVRLSHGAIDKSYAEIIVNEIENSSELRVNRQNDGKIINTNGQSLSFLWDYFCQTKFYNQEDKEVYPVIVLDQFEEIFISQDLSQKEKAGVLMKQIHALLSDDFVILDHDTFSDETNYRFVASIREDNLYLLEDCIDELALPFFKKNRFRLRPMKEEQAKNAVLIPGRKCICEQDKETLALKIIDAAKDNDGTVSSLMLSFICSELFEKAADSSTKHQIDLKLFNEHRTESQRLLTNFYLQHTSKKQRKIIENYFITEDGHRKPSSEVIPHGKALVEKYNIIQDAKTENRNAFEIVHDRLAEVVYKHRRQRETKKFRYVLSCLLLVLMMVLLGIAVNLSWSSSIQNKNLLAIHNYSNNTSHSDTVLKEKIVSASFRYNDTIKIIEIGETVDSIESLSANSKQKIVVSAKNKRINSNYIYRYRDYDADSILYLYQIDNPQIALYIHNDINSYDSLRLPEGIKFIQFNGQTFWSAANVPYYGKEDITIKSDRDLKLTHGDKRVKSLFIRNVTKIKDYQYAGCVSLEKVDMGVEELEFGDACFINCSNLQEVVFPHKLTLLSSAKNEFSCCFNLRKITLPDIVENTENLAQMFQWCPNISEIKYHSEKTHFKEKEDGVIYYDSIPVLFNRCKATDWVNKDSTLFIKEGIVYNKLMGGFNVLNILSSHWEGDHVLRVPIKDSTYCIGAYFIYEKGISPRLFLPIEGYGRYCYVGYNPYLTEIHTPVADPKVFDFQSLDMNIDMSNVTLYVPYGCKDAYIYSGKYDKFKEIKEDSWRKRVELTLKEMWLGIKYTFDAYLWLLFPLVLILLALLAFVFYKLKIYQMNRQGVVSKEKALLYAVLADLAAIIGFVPVYWIFYYFGCNHYKFESIQFSFMMTLVLIIFAYFVIRLIIDTRQKLLWPWLLFIVVIMGGFSIVYVMNKDVYTYKLMTLSSFYGGLSGYICAYLTIFAGNGKILNKMKRWKFSS